MTNLCQCMAAKLNVIFSQSQDSKYYWQTCKWTLGFDNFMSSNHQASSTKNRGDKQYLPHTYHEEMRMGRLGKKLKENCPAAKNMWNDLTTKA